MDGLLPVCKSSNMLTETKMLSMLDENRISWTELEQHLYILNRKKRNGYLVGGRKSPDKPLLLNHGIDCFSILSILNFEPRHGRHVQKLRNAHRLSTGMRCGAQKGAIHLQRIPLNGFLLNDSFLLLAQNMPGSKQLSHCKHYLDNGSILDIPLRDHQ